jgi:hypothetical protein
LEQGTVAATNSDIAKIREELISWIADESLGGDRDAAEWILLISIARVYVFHFLSRGFVRR